MATKSDKYLSQTYIAKRVQKILDLAEEKLINVLNGTTKVPEKLLVQVALEIYKRRIPQKVEPQEGANQLTVVKIVKNHLPNADGDVVDITAASGKVEELADNIINTKAKLINEKMKQAVRDINRPRKRDKGYEI